MMIVDFQMPIPFHLLLWVCENNKNEWMTDIFWCVQYWLFVWWWWFGDGYIITNVVCLICLLDIFTFSGHFYFYFWKVYMDWNRHQESICVCVCVWPKTKIYRFCKFRWNLHVIFFLLSVIQSILPKGNVGFFVTFFHQISLLLLLLLIWIKQLRFFLSCKSIRFFSQKINRWP